LAALEPALELEPGARLRALVPATRLHALPAALAAPDALLRVLRALGRFEIAQIHRRPQGRLKAAPTLSPQRDDEPCESCRASRACPAAPPCGEAAAVPCPG